MVTGFSLWALQGLIMFFDEFIFHHKRGLPKWERIGHPIDTFSFLLCFLFCLIFQYSAGQIVYTFYALAFFSSLIITKDEWVHKYHCSAIENWLHSILFILHPTSLFVLYFFWQNDQRLLIVIQSVLISAFMFYQIFYWNIIRPNRQRNFHENDDKQ